MGAAVAATGLVPHPGRADGTAPAAPSVMQNQPRSWGPDAPLVHLPDPDILVIDPAFKDLLYSNAALQLAWRGAGWLEGPAWSTEGRFLLLSDPVRSRQYRLLWENNSVSTYCEQSFNANGNAYDATGRLLTCEQGLRRVIRHEHDGAITVLADRFRGHSLNTPNDIVASPDGSVWFSDPTYGADLAEGHPDAPGNRANPTGRLRWNLDNELIGQTGGTGVMQDHVFRIDEAGRIEAVLDQSQVPGPNGLCFSPDHATLYVVSTGSGPGQRGPAGDRTIRAFDMRDGRPTNGRVFCDMSLDGHRLVPDGIRTDVFGNLWCGASGPLGLCGVLVYAANGRLIGRLRLPVGISNLTFGGPKRNRLFMCGGTALFFLDLNTQGAGYS